MKLNQLAIASSLILALMSFNVWAMDASPTTDPEPEVAIDQGGNLKLVPSSKVPKSPQANTPSPSIPRNAGVPATSSTAVQPLNRPSVGVPDSPSTSSGSIGPSSPPGMPQGKSGPPGMPQGMSGPPAGY